MKTGHYFTRYVDIDKSYLDHLSPDREGAPRLKIDLYYYKEGNPRGLKLCITRMLCGDTFELSSLVERCNAYMSVLPLERKNDKIGRLAAQVIEDNLDEIVRVSLESDRPDFQSLLNDLAPKMREATGKTHAAA